jgi:hypothetical protein
MERSELLELNFDSFIEFADELGLEVTPGIAWNEALFMAHRLASEYLTIEQIGRLLIQIETIASTDSLTRTIKEIK